MSVRQEGVLFAINDSGNEPILYALDTKGSDRGAWRLTGTTNADWEAAALGPFGSRDSTVSSAERCIYIGDVGDNEAKRPSRTLYRVLEPTAQEPGFVGDLPSERVEYRYFDGPRDVEALYVTPSGATMLISKRRLTEETGALRPALVYEVPASAWGSDTIAVAQRVDSLPIVPGSAQDRQITDASLSTDGRYLAVRTYAEVYVFSVDSLTGLPRKGIPPARCSIVGLEDGYGEGITWYDATTLLLTREGLNAPLILVHCPLPSSR